MKLSTVTLYRDDSVSQVVIQNVKHQFLTGGNTVITMAEVVNIETGEHIYKHYPLARIAWWKVETQK